MLCLLLIPLQNKKEINGICNGMEGPHTYQTQASIHYVTSLILDSTTGKTNVCLEEADECLAGAGDKKLNRAEGCLLHVTVFLFVVMSDRVYTVKIHGAV
jgi:hypothetical protein